jgi:hypothetical protein
VCTSGEFTGYFEHLKTANFTDATASSSRSYLPAIVVGPTINERLAAAA